jgi:hypothetical protein
MSAPVSLALVVIGGVLLFWGLQASDSIGSEFSELFTGSPTDKAVWMLIGGIVAACVGLFGSVRSAK